MTDAREVWPDFRDHMLWVRRGNDGWFEATGATTYGANGRQSNDGSMPPFASLDDQELAQVVLYERVTFAGLEEGDEEYEALVAIAQGEATLADAGVGDVASAAGVDSALLAPG